MGALVLMTRHERDSEGCVFLSRTMQSQYVLLVAEYPLDYLTSTRFVIGSILFAVGMAINIHSDSILLNLRKPGETGYKIPRVSTVCSHCDVATSLRSSCAGGHVRVGIWCQLFG